MPAHDRGWRVVTILTDEHRRVRPPAVRISVKNVDGRPSYSHTLGILVEETFQPRTHIPDREAGVYAALLDLAVEKVADLKRPVQTSAPVVSRRRRQTKSSAPPARAETPSQR